jgi:oligopeptide transport system ATP-binding protein
LEVRDLRSYFDAPEGVVRAVDGVSFSLEEGETLGLVGESGCGKSITARSLLRLVPPPGRIVGGEVLLDGRDLLGLSNREMRAVRGERIALIPQDPMASLNPVLTIGSQLAEMLRRRRQLSKAAVRERVLDMLGLVGIPSPHERLAAYPHLPWLDPRVRYG